jgi:3'-5' exoribonuclease
LEIINLKNIQIGAVVKGLVLSKKLRTVETSRKTEGLIGEFEYKGVCVNFAFWDYSPTSNIKDVFNSQGFAIFEIEATVETYNDLPSLKCKKMVLTSAKRSDFELTLDTEGIANELFNTLKTNISKPARDIVMKVFEQENVLTLFTEGYAASKHHDALRGGLINHTNKMLNIGVSVIKNNKLEPHADLILLGILFHDIGKIYEIVDGGYTGSPLNHRYHGLSVLEKIKSYIVEVKSLEFYEHLIAIIIGHHDGLGGGERAETVWAKIIHLIDMLESGTTSLIEELDKVTDTSINSFYYGDRYYKF